MTRKSKTTAAKFIACTPVSLPAHQWVEAAKTAVSVNPINSPWIHKIARADPNLVLSPLHIALMTSKYWSAGKVDLGVGFLETTAAELQAKILAFANKWGQYGNITFRAASPATAEIRISRGTGGYYSYLGTDCLHIPRGQQTMNLEQFTLKTEDSEYDRVVTHEFGHALGFVHEHQRPAEVARIDPAKAIAYFGRTQGWSAAEVRAQVLTPLDESLLKGTDVDDLSVMCYQIDGSLTIDGKPIVGGTKINARDGDFAGRVYPKQVAPPPPPNPPVNPPSPPAPGAKFRAIISSESPILFTPQ